MTFNILSTEIDYDLATAQSPVSDPKHSTPGGISCNLSLHHALSLTGNGHNDSPGHSAKYCMYTLMETDLDIIGQYYDF